MLKVTLTSSKQFQSQISISQPPFKSFGGFCNKFDIFIFCITQNNHTLTKAFVVEYESTKECLVTNYYGAKAITKALLPHFRHSLYGGRIINVGSVFGNLNVRPSHCQSPMNIDFHVFFSDLKFGSPSLECSHETMKTQLLPSY